MQSEAETRLSFISSVRQSQPDGSIQSLITRLRETKEAHSGSLRLRGENRQNLNQAWEHYGGANKPSILRLAAQAHRIDREFPIVEERAGQIESLRAALRLITLLREQPSITMGISPENGGLRFSVPKDNALIAPYVELQTALQALFAEEWGRPRVVASAGTGLPDRSITVSNVTAKELSLFLSDVLDMPAEQIGRAQEALLRGQRCGISLSPEHTEDQAAWSRDGASPKGGPAR